MADLKQLRMQWIRAKSKVRPDAIAKLGVLPALFYLTTFIVLTYPLIRRFSTHLFADPWDGLVFYWNLWWVNKAVTDLHQSPWHTSYLNYPFGVSLLPHTLSPFNGFLAIPLLRFLTLIQVYNVLVIFSFAASGLTAFLLAHYFTRSYWPSIFAGYVFTFSSYHFAHMEGHLNLVSLEWVPLFVLCWYILVVRPGVTIAITTGIVLFAVILCDYYYFFYCILIGVIIFVWHGLRTKNPGFFLERKYLVSLTVFLSVVLVTSGPLVISLLRLNSADPFTGHDPLRNSMDALAPVIPGSHWRFANLTRFYWSRLPGDTNENSVYLGWTVIFLLLYAWRRRPAVPSSPLWFFLVFCFGILALGPVLHVWGTEYSVVKLPYAILEKVFPPLQASGVPVRMMIICTLAASVLCAIGLAEASRRSLREQVFAAIVIVALVVEYLPKPRVYSALRVPEFVSILKAKPGKEAVLDTVSDPFQTMYHQTVHEKPMASAVSVLSRTPHSVAMEGEEVKRLIENGDYIRLRNQYQIRYLVTDAAKDLESENDSVKHLYGDSKVKLYELRPE
jgi:hypothetical protein